MSRLLRTIAVALGLTTIYTAWLVEPLVKLRHDVAYHWSGAASTLFGPVAIYIAAVWAVLTLLLLSAQRPGRWRVAVWATVLLWIPWIAARTLLIDWQWNLQWRFVPRFSVLLIVLLVLIVLWPRFSKWYEGVFEFAGTVLMFVALSGTFFLVEFALSWWAAPKATQSMHAQRIAATSDPKPRIIWIILDELSYQQVYERRYPGLQLPAFDALAGDATVFTRVVPAGAFTEVAVPSLLTGRRFDDLRPTANGQPVFRSADGGRWQRFDEHDTVFGDAQRWGYRTSVAGWYNPYCRILATVLDSCYWSNLYDMHDGIAGNQTLGSNLRAPLAVLVPSNRWESPATRWMHIPALGVRGQAMQTTDYQNLLTATNAELRDESAGLVLLHMPIPHPPGIYNRMTGKFATNGGGSYIDNLALADRYLAHVRDVLTETGQWDSSTVVVMGDHSWRTSFVWKELPGWTIEDARASRDGQFDDRPGYIVKLAGQKSGERIDVPFRALNTRGLFDALMAGKIQSAEDLRRWVEQSEPAH
jgi:hypothetical protein